MSIAYSATLLEIILLITVAGFQVAVVAGAPLGEYCWGGQHSGVLPRRLRIASGFSLLLYAAMAGHYASTIGWLPSLLDAYGRAYVLWGLTAFSALSVLANTATKSKKERMVFAPIAALMLLGNILILVFYRLG